MGIFNEQSLDHPFARGIQGAPGVGFNLTSSGDYDMINKKLRNVGVPSANTDAATKKYVDDNSTGTPSTSRLTVDSSIDMKNQYRILNLKHPVDADEPATKQYSESRFLDRNGSRTMIGNLSMNNNKIIKLGAPTANDDAANKKYVDDNSTGTPSTSRLTVDSNIDMKNRYRITNLITPQDSKDPATKYYVDSTFLDRDGSYPMKGNLNMDNNRIINLPAPTGSNQPTPLAFTDMKYLHVAGTNKMTNNLNMDNKKIINLRPPTASTDAATKKYVDDKTSSGGSSGSRLDLSNYLKKDGSVAMTGNLNLGNKKIVGLATPTSNTDAATKKYVDDNSGSPDLSDYLEKDGTVAMTGNLNLGNNKIVNLSDPTTDQQAANRGWVRKQIDRLDHHSGDASSGVFTITDPAAPTTLYLQYITGSSFDDFVFTTSAPGQPLVGWAPTANTYINKIEFQFGSRNVNVDFLWFIPRDSSQSNSNFWVSGNRTGTWTLNIHKSWSYDMSGVKLRTHNNSNHTAITCRLFTELPKAITKPLKRIEINTPKIVISGVVKADVNLGGNKIENLGVPTQDTDSVNKGYVDNLVRLTAIQPSHYKNEFAYLMSSGSQWTDEIDGGNSFGIRSIGDLAPNKGNFHDYNHKVIYMSIIKNSQGKYIYKMGINFFRLAANTDYTLCLEILNTDYNLWNNTQISVDKGTSKGLSIGNLSVKKLSHNYSDLTRKTQTMYYHRIIVNFRKLPSGNKFFLHILVDILRGGYNLATYPRQFLGVYLVAYGIKGTFSNIDPDKVYDYHTAFDIKPTEVVYNVDINANQKEIKNVKLNRSDDDSVATVAMVNEVNTLTKYSFLRTFFNDFYDFSNANQYGVRTGSYGIILTSVKPNITLPVNVDISRLGLGSLNINGYRFTFTPPNSPNLTLCLVFVHWRNRNFSLIKRDGSKTLYTVSYNKNNNVLTFNFSGSDKTMPMPSSFNGKHITLWLTESRSPAITKVNISNYSTSLIWRNFSYPANLKFTFECDDGIMFRLMYSPNFYDVRESVYHKVMLQEKLLGSHVE